MVVLKEFGSTNYESDDGEKSSLALESRNDFPEA